MRIHDWNDPFGRLFLQTLAMVAEFEANLIRLRTREGMAVVCTAGLAGRHDFDDGHGIDLDDLGDDHSLASDPTVARLRTQAAALGEDLWIAVRFPAGYEGGDDAPEPDEALTRWTTVVLHPDELGWLREALADNAAAGHDDPQQS